MKPCPFCGHDAAAPEKLGTDHWAIWCPVCEFYGPRGQSEAMAAVAWDCREKVKEVADV